MRRATSNFLTALPLVIAISFCLSMWQNNGRLLPDSFSFDGFSLSGYLSIPSANAQASTCLSDPVVAGPYEGRIYYNKSCNQFRMSRNGGAWEDLGGGGGLWKYYTSAVSPFITSNDIHNGNAATGSGATYDPALVFVNTMSVFGVSDWGNAGNPAEVLSLSQPTDNLIYAAAAFNSDASSNLLKLERWIGQTSFEPVFSVGVSGDVTIATNGKLITPQICMPNADVADNCITSWDSLKGGSDTSSTAASDLWWTQSDPSTPGEIKNRNLLSSTDQDLGGNIRVTNTLNVAGQINLSKNLSNTSVWSTLGIPTSATGGTVTDVWFDYDSSTYHTTYLDGDDYDSLNGNGTVVLAVTEEGKIIVTRSEAYSTSIPLLDGATNGLVNISDVATSTAAAKPLRGVCTLGNANQSGNRSKYKIVAVGDDGEIWMYGDQTGEADGSAAGDFYWIRLTASAVPAGHVNTTPAFYDVWCKPTSTGTLDASYSTADVYAVGQYGAIARYSVGGSSSYTWVRPPCGPGDEAAADCGGVQKPDLHAIWATKYTLKYPARYYAVGDTTGAVNKVLYWAQTLGNPTIQSVDVSTTKNFYTVKGQGGLCEYCGDAKKVYIAGEGGIMYNAVMNDSVAPSFTQVMNGTSSLWDIRGLLVNSKIVFASMESKNMSATNQSFSVKYAPVSGFGILNQPEAWLDAPFLNNSKYLGMNVSHIDGFARDRRGASATTFDRQTFRIYVGGTKSLTMDAVTVYFMNSQESPTSWASDVNGSYRSAVNWTERTYGAGVNLYSSWQPANLSSDSTTSSFIGGDSGVIWKGEWEYVPVLGYDANTTKKMTVRGLWGYPRAGNAYIPYEVFGVVNRRESDNRYSGYILRFNQDNSSPGFTKVKDYATTADAQYYGLNAVWSSGSGNLVIAVGQKGRVLYCTANCDTQASTWTQRAALGGTDLVSIYGKADGSVFFIVESSGTIWRCTNINTCSSYLLGEPLNAVWVRDRSNEAWVAGDNGVVLYNSNVTTGNGWTALPVSSSVPTIGNYKLTSVGGAANKVFFGASSGQILYSVNGASNWRLDTVGPSASSINTIAGTEWSTYTQGMVWAGGSNSLGRKYVIGGAALSGDLKAEFNRWGMGSTTISPLPGNFVPCAEGQFIVGCSATHLFIR